MAVVVPFNGVVYNQNKIGSLDNVITEPYDVISPEEQKRYYERHPNNIIRLILGKTSQQDTAENNPHTRAASLFNSWISENILVRDPIPALYYTKVSYTIADQAVCRSGFIALVGLEAYDQGVVLPHEKTFSKVKSERLRLMKACHTNFSPIFSLYTDQTNRIGARLAEAVEGKSPDFVFSDHKNHHHQLWRITDRVMIDFVSKEMQDKPLYIADGHHRYETALNYRSWIAEKNDRFDVDHPANYVMMYLSSMEDPGQTILPAHHLLKDINTSLSSTFIEQCDRFFETTTFPFTAENREKRMNAFLAALSSDVNKNKLGVFIRGINTFYLLTLKAGVMEKECGPDLSDSLKNLDVTVLNRLVLKKILGFDQKRLNNENLISYSSSLEDASRTILSGYADMALILNPTRIDQVREISEQGLIMPRKSTYFYPKVLTGLVLNTLVP